MEKSIVKFISINPLDSDEINSDKVNQTITEMPNDYQIVDTQMIQVGNTYDSYRLMLVFNQVPNTTANGFNPPAIQPSNLGNFGGVANVPTQKQLNYLAKLVDAIQPEDFPGLDEITTKKLAGQWIAKLTKIQKENHGK